MHPSVGADLNITVIAKDGALNSVNCTFNVFIFQNTPPVASYPSGNYSVIDNQTFTYSKDLSTIFTDVDSNQTMTYYAVNAPAFVTSSLSGSIFTMSGTVSDTNSGQYNITFRCNDG